MGRHVQHEIPIVVNNNNRLIITDDNGVSINNIIHHSNKFRVNLENANVLGFCWIPDFQIPGFPDSWISSRKRGGRTDRVGGQTHSTKALRAHHPVVGGHSLSRQVSGPANDQINNAIAPQRYWNLLNFLDVCGPQDVPIC